VLAALLPRARGFSGYRLSAAGMAAKPSHGLGCLRPSGAALIWGCHVNTVTISLELSGLHPGVGSVCPWGLTVVEQVWRRFAYRAELLYTNRAGIEEHRQQKLAEANISGSVESFCLGLITCFEHYLSDAH